MKTIQHGNMSLLVIHCIRAACDYFYDNIQSQEKKNKKQVMLSWGLLLPVIHRRKSLEDAMLPRSCEAGVAVAEVWSSF